MEPDQPRRSLAIPVAIVIGALILGFAVYLTQRGDPDLITEPVPSTERTAKNVRPVGPTDWIRGNPNAPIIIVEYSDFECPFCKQYHQTLRRIVEEFGKDGKVAWVFRHFPISELHQKAPAEALAAQCAGVLGGNDVFWSFADRIFETTNGNDTLDLALLPQFAEELGINRSEFEACQAGGLHMASVEADFQNAIESGGTGTPYSIIIANNTPYPISGAQPYPAILAVINALLQQITITDLTPPSRANTATTVPQLPPRPETIEEETSATSTGDSQ